MKRMYFTNKGSFIVEQNQDGTLRISKASTMQPLKNAGLFIVSQGGINAILANCKEVSDEDFAKDRIMKGLERRKRNLEAKLRDVQNSIAKNKDHVADFKMMGIDHIFVDESHMFKNLGFVTRQDRVAGLGNTEGSKRAYNLLMAIRTIQQRTNKDLGVTFLSGTTVTNSLTELYSLFRYLRPKAMAKQGITCFDAWAAIFTKKSTEFEFSITNQIIMKERFRYFIKVPELAQFYNEITDFRTAEDVCFKPNDHDPDHLDLVRDILADFDVIGEMAGRQGERRLRTKIGGQHHEEF